VLDARCPICQGEIPGKLDYKELNCGNYFHKGCLEEWMQVSTTCPLCKASIKTKFVDGKKRLLTPEELRADVAFKIRFY
jgi:E3 ubiquitin-protein ligase DOA10